MIATGTGIAPFRSMLAANLADLRTQVTLLLGARYSDTLLYREEFEELARKHPNFRFWPTVTRPGEDWTAAPAACSSTSRKLWMRAPTSMCILRLKRNGRRYSQPPETARLRPETYHLREVRLASAYPSSVIGDIETEPQSASERFDFRFLNKQEIAKVYAWLHACEQPPGRLKK